MDLRSGPIGADSSTDFDTYIGDSGLCSGAAFLRTGDVVRAIMRTGPQTGDVEGQGG